MALMSMGDIAALARVRRPVVTVWRRRFAAAHSDPFPNACEHRDHQEFFDSDQVVGWLERTGRGNNPDVRSEVAAHSVRATLSDAPQAASALLTLRHMAGEPLGLAADSDAVVDLADEYDPDDRLLLREIEQADDALALARLGDDLVEACWGTSGAHDVVLRQLLALPGGDLWRAGVSTLALEMLVAVAAPLWAELGDGVRLMDPTGCGVQATERLATALDAEVVVMAGDSAAHRLTRRLLALADRPTSSLARDAGEWSIAGRVLHVVVVPDAAAPDSTPAEQLSLLDEVSLQLDEQQVAVALAPASTLTDPLAGEALVIRDQLLRAGQVRAIVRLPAGLRTARPREQLGLWVLGAPDGRAAIDRRTMVGDLSGTPLTPAAIDDLASDLLAAWQGESGARRRAWAHLHPVSTSQLVSASGSLVPPRVAASAAPAQGGADQVVKLRAADTAGRLGGYGLQVRAGVPDHVTIAAAIERGWVRVLPGRRLDPAALPAGGVRVLGPELAQRGSRGVDRLALAAVADPSLTRPRDVVFTARPVPRAVVDDDGGSLVVAPARVLRVAADAPLVAAAVAARINAATTTDWRLWRLAAVAEPDRAVLAAALDDLAADRVRLLDELAALDALTHDLTRAVENRQLHLTKENDGATTH